MSNISKIIKRLLYGRKVCIINGKEIELSRRQYKALKTIKSCERLPAGAVRIIDKMGDVWFV